MQLSSCVRGLFLCFLGQRGGDKGKLTVQGSGNLHQRVQLGGCLLAFQPGYDGLGQARGLGELLLGFSPGGAAPR